MEEDFYSVDEAARILQLTPGRIRQMLRAGELEGAALRIPSQAPITFSRVNGCVILWRSPLAHE